MVLICQWFYFPDHSRTVAFVLEVLVNTYPISSTKASLAIMEHQVAEDCHNDEGNSDNQGDKGNSGDSNSEN